ncbi:hypothetical protein LINPERPRIM_LOCUS37761 [Linum perenne]
MFKNVPPVLVTIEGISWVSSKIGKPLNKFVRNGLNVRVCLVRDGTKPCPEVVKVEVEDGVSETIDVMRFQAREYTKVEDGVSKESVLVNVEKVWVVKDPGKKVVQDVAGAYTSGEKDIPEGALVFVTRIFLKGLLCFVTHLKLVKKVMKLVLWVQEQVKLRREGRIGRKIWTRCCKQLLHPSPLSYL